jgi:hypothetical protein
LASSSFFETAFFFVAAAADDFAVAVVLLAADVDFVVVVLLLCAFLLLCAAPDLAVELVFVLVITIVFRMIVGDVFTCAIFLVCAVACKQSKDSMNINKMCFIVLLICYSGAKVQI